MTKRLYEETASREFQTDDIAAEPTRRKFLFYFSLLPPGFAAYLTFERFEFDRQASAGRRIADVAGTF
jgi:hypothetical protein